MRNKPLTLLCFAYAGGSAQFYSRWSPLLTNVRIIPVEIPGRGAAHGSSPLVERDELINYLLCHYAYYCVPPFALFGHSLGARIAFEFLSVLEQTLGLRAVRLLVSGCLAPERFAQAMHGHDNDLSDSTLLSILHKLGGTPPELIADASLMTTALPVIRSDFRLAIDLSTYLVAPVEAPINLILGNEDKLTSLFEEPIGWTRCTFQSCQVSVIDGDHFFIRSRVAVLASLVNEILKEAIVNDD